MFKIIGDGLWLWYFLPIPGCSVGACRRLHDHARRSGPFSKNPGNTGIAPLKEIGICIYSTALVLANECQNYPVCAFFLYASIRTAGLATKNPFALEGQAALGHQVQRCALPPFQGIITSVAITIELPFSNLVPIELGISPDAISWGLTETFSGCRPPS